MVLMSSIYDIGLPPLCVLVLCSLQHWILNRNKRKRSSKNRFNYDNKSVENGTGFSYESTKDEIPISYPEYLLNKKNVTTSENINLPFILEDKSASEQFLEIEDSRNTRSHNEIMSKHKISEEHDLILSESDEPVVSENIEQNFTEDVITIHETTEVDHAKTSLYKEVVDVIEIIEDKEFVLSSSTSYVELSKCISKTCYEVSGEKDISDEGQTNKYSGEVAVGSKEIFGDCSECVKKGEDVKEVFEMIIKNNEESEDAKSQTSGGTNEISEDSGVDNMDRQKSSARESLSKSEDCDSCISSEDMTLVTENDATELEVTTEEKSDLNSHINLGTNEEACPDDEEAEIMEDQSYTSFFFPKSLVGTLIGRGGMAARTLFDETGANVTIIDHNNNLVVVELSGICAEDVMNGLMYLRERYADYVSVDFDTILEETYDVTGMKRYINKEDQLKYTHISHKYKLPSNLIGMLSGRNGEVVDKISLDCGVDINVGSEIDGRCAIVIAGLPERIEDAKCAIMEMFPEVDLAIPLPQPSLKRFPILRTNFLIPNESMETVKVSSVLSPNHVFIHRTMLQSNHNLKTFSLDLNKAYTNGRKDLLPHPIRLNTLCIVEHDGSFYRAVTTDCKRNETKVMFVDFGGEKVYQNSELYVIRNEFVDYCFQAVECFLDGISPISGQRFSADAVKFMQAELANKQFVMRTVFTDSMGRTYIELYGNKGGEKGFVNIAATAASANLVSHNPTLKQ